MDIIKNAYVYGITDSVRASKFPMSVDTDLVNGTVTDRTHKLAMADIGSGHDQFLTGIIVQFDLTFSLKAWTELQRYHFIDFVSSQSTMHRIIKLDIDQQCNDFVDKKVIDILHGYVDRYNANPTAENYLYCLYNVPTGFRLTARMTTNYRQLKTIYKQRKAHRLPEWRDFCKWIETLPNAEWITGKA